MSIEQLRIASNLQEERAAIVRERDMELYWGNTAKAQELTKKLRDLPQGTRAARRDAARQVRRAEVRSARNTKSTYQFIGQ